nr:MAG TPA: hypothetical protein [Caudoviricetes sp.]
MLCKIIQQNYKKVLTEIHTDDIVNVVHERTVIK